jgi:ornithine cyclodeaminase/alanine dehydrogenase
MSGRVLFLGKQSSKTISMDTNFPVSDSITVLDRSAITANVSMPEAIGLMETAFRILSEKSASIPDRTVISTPDDSLSIFFKPAFLSVYNRMSIKILTQLHGNSNGNGPTIRGMVFLFDMLSGRVLSISDGISVTALRTGAASGLATRYLANPDASSVAIFGCGAQGVTQLEAVMAVRNIRRVMLFDPSPGQAASLLNTLASRSDAVCVVNPDLSELKTADIICTATPSRKPLFSAGHLKSGVHINAVGSYRTDMQELDPSILGMGRIYLDDSPACLSQSGDLTIPLDMGIITPQSIMGEIGELIAGTIPGRRTPDEITVFKSVGNAIQDFFIANEAYKKSINSPDNQIINLTS